MRGNPSVPSFHIDPVWIPMPTTAGMTKFVVDCKCYPLHSVLGQSEKEFSAAMKELKFKSNLGYAGAMNIQLLQLANDTTTTMEFPALTAYLPHLQVHERSYGSSDLKWIMFNCELTTKSSPSDQKGKEAPIWLDHYTAKTNEGKQINVIEGSPKEKRIELQMGRRLIADQEWALEEMVENEKAKQKEGEMPVKKKRKTSVKSHTMGGGTYTLPSSKIPISKNLYKNLLEKKLGENEVAVTETQFDEYQSLRVERLNSLGSIMNPVYGALINDLHNRLIISVTQNANSIGTTNRLRKENEVLKKKNTKEHELLKKKYTKETDQLKNKHDTLQSKYNLLRQNHQALEKREAAQAKELKSSSCN